ncbi:hypothetical protein FA95DRAFT_994947 [Auriscalpium vulgare]|uniref:Uncharacterized protein n=1 Tax=Auriscalpium vulgare TaxID=40419 RepID=A0ACB8RXZ3_9AGAM|nr:hypothetical protein FA95DRAFT_994947 [Auriscalpium vulgare]
MSQNNHPPSSPSFRTSWFPPSKFKEHLSLTVPPPDAPIEHSHFSPESPPPFPNPQSTRSFSFGSSTMYKASPASKTRDLEKGSTANSTPRSGAFRDRFTKMFFEMRAPRRQPELDIPIQEPELPDHYHEHDHVHMAEWPPLNVRKQHHCSCRRHETVLQKWRRRAWITALLLFLLYVLVNLIILNTRAFPSSSNSSTPTSSPAPAPPSGLSADAQQCINEYTLNAPASPTTYPCSTCLPLLSQLPANSTAVYPTAVDATQFCALRSLWEDAGSDGQQGLEAGGWVQDVRFCAWNGVRCDGAGQVSSVSLTFPAVPASITAEFTNLTALESLTIVGNNVAPGGPLPSSFPSLTSLSSLSLQSTGLGPLPDNLQNLTSLTLVGNAQMGTSLPASISQSALTALIVNNETLSLTPDQQTAICTNALGGQLRTCDLRGSGIQTCGSCLVG